MFVSAEPTRPLVILSVAKLLQLKFPENRTYRFYIVDEGKTGSYDLLVEFLQEPVTGGKYVKLWIVQGGDPATHQLRMISPIFGPLAGADKKRFNALSLMPAEALVNGYLSCTAGVPSTALDNYDALKTVLDEYFKPAAAGASKEPAPSE